MTTKASGEVDYDTEIAVSSHGHMAEVCRVAHDGPAGPIARMHDLSVMFEERREDVDIRSKPSQVTGFLVQIQSFGSGCRRARADVVRDAGSEVSVDEEPEPPTAQVPNQRIESSHEFPRRAAIAKSAPHFLKGRCAMRLGVKEGGVSSFCCRDSCCSGFPEEATSTRTSWGTISSFYRGSVVAVVETKLTMRGKRFGGNAPETQAHTGRNRVWPFGV